MCVLEFDGRSDFYSKSHPTARKQHRCIACGRVIEPGTRYLRESAKWEGSVFSDACCLDCETDRDAFADAHHGTFPHANYFVECLRGCIHEGDAESDVKWQPMLERIVARGKAAA